MIAIYLVLYLLAAVLFALSTFGMDARRLHLLSAGLFCLTLVLILQTIKKV